MPRPRAKATVDLPVTIIVAMPHTIPEQVLLEALEPLSVALAEYGAAASLNVAPARITIDMLVAAPDEDLTRSLDSVALTIEQCMRVLDDVLGDAHSGRVVSLTVQTEQARDEALAARDEARNLMGIAEIAEWRGQLRQAVQRVVKYPDFPRPVAELKAGPVFIRREVEQYYARQDARQARKGSIESGSAAPDQPQRARLAALLAEHLERHPELGDGDPQPAWVAAAGRPHVLLHGPALETGVQALGGPTRVAEQVGVQRRQVHRWLTWAKTDEATSAAPRTTVTAGSTGSA
jgi:hypothetical protein